MSEAEDTIPIDFPILRRTILDIADVVGVFASSMKCHKVPLKDREFRWAPVEMDAKAVQVAKAVRIASGLKAALHLADFNHVAEVNVILRTVADFGSEIGFVAEGMLEGRFTSEQQRFVEQHFGVFPSDPDELAAREREYYIGRKEIAKSIRRIAQKAGDNDADRMLNIVAYLNKGYDSFVHGANHASMELFTGRGMRFMMAGHESEYHVCISKSAIFGKTMEALNALALMALAWQRIDLHDTIRKLYKRLETSEERSAKPCEEMLANLRKR